MTNIFIGDSMILRFDLGRYFGDNAINKGMIGNNTCTTLNVIEDILSLEPSKIFLMIGINDVINDFNTDEIFQNYEKIIKKIKERDGNIKIYIHSILPAICGSNFPNINIEKINNINNKLKEYSNTYGNVNYIDLISLYTKEDGYLDPAFTYDGIHLNNYEPWVNKIRELLN